MTMIIVKLALRRYDAMGDSSQHGDKHERTRNLPSITFKYFFQTY